MYELEIELKNTMKELTENTKDKINKINQLKCIESIHGCLLDIIYDYLHIKSLIEFIE